MFSNYLLFKTIVIISKYWIYTKLRPASKGQVKNYRALSENYLKLVKNSFLHVKNYWALGKNDLKLV